MYGMEVRADYTYIGDDTLGGKATVWLNDVIEIRDVKILNLKRKDSDEARHDIFLPRQRVVHKDGTVEWKDVIDVSPELKKEIHMAVLEAMQRSVYGQPDFDETIAEVRLAKSGNTLGYADVSFRNLYTLKNLRIMNGPSGRFLSLPASRNAAGGYDQTLSVKPFYWNDIQDAVFREYDRQMELLEKQAPAKPENKNKGGRTR